MKMVMISMCYPHTLLLFLGVLLEIQMTVASGQMLRVIAALLGAG
jgi:hypothetical protein